MGKPKAPEGPSFKELLALGQQQIDASKDLFDRFMVESGIQSDKLNRRADEFHELSMASAEEQLDWSRQQKQRWEEMAIPTENALIKKQTEYDTPERREQRAATAAADVVTSQKAAREMQLKTLEGYGIDPSMTRNAALDFDARQRTALASAKAATDARDKSELTGIAMLSDAANVTKGLPGQAAGSVGAGINAGNAGLAGGVNAANFSNNRFGQGQDMLASSAQSTANNYGVANSIYGNDLAKYNTQMANSPLNTVAGLAGTAIGAGWGMADKGGWVDPEMSPSRGAVPDDVPMLVGAGEAILTRRAVEWHGKKAIHDLEKKAAEADQAIPVGAA